MLNKHVSLLCPSLTRVFASSKWCVCITVTACARKFCEVALCVQSLGWGSSEGRYKHSSRRAPSLFLRCLHLVPNTEDSVEESEGKLPLPSQIFHLLFFFSNSQLHKMEAEPSQSLSMIHQSTGHSAWHLKVLKETLSFFLVSLSLSLSHPFPYPELNF